MSISRAIALVAGTAIAAGAQDTIRVRGDGVPAWGPKITLTKVMAIGGADATPEYELNSVQAFTVDPQNRFYLYDANAKQLRAYDAAGKFLRNIGRTGAGPGEYKWVFGMGILRDSLLAVFDISNARVTLFEPSGKLVRTIPNSRMTNGFDNGFSVERGGLMSFRVPSKVNGQSNVEVAVEGPGPGVVVSNGYALRMKEDGSLVDSIPIPPPGKQTRMFYLMGADGGNSNFVAEPHVAVSTAGAVVFGHSSAYRFVIRTPTTARVVEQPWTPVPVSSGERDNWTAWADYMSKQDRGRFTYEIPKTKPAYRGLMTDDDGRIWVSVYMQAEKRDVAPRPAGDARPLLVWRQSATYDVFDPNGLYLGRVQLEKDSQLLGARGDRIWVLSKAADDEQILTSYRLTGIAKR